MSFNISKFQGALKFGGARPTHFRVDLATPFDRDLNNISSFLIQATSLPPSNIGPVEVPYMGRKIRVAGDRTFDPWSVTVINDEDFKIRQAMERWHNQINSLSLNTNLTGSSAPANYKYQARVMQYSKASESFDSPIRTYEFYGLFPLEISSIDLDWNATDDIERFTVTFSYDWYQVVGGNTGQLT